jgi:hypothetical protein
MFPAAGEEYASTCVQDATRIGENESRLRKVNEGIDAGRGLADVDERLPFICECGRLGCSEVIELRVGDYERVRRSGRRFVVMPGHANDEVERVVEDAGTYVVVEKIGAAADAAEAHDPRAG